MILFLVVCISDYKQVVYYSLNKSIWILFPRCNHINAGKVDVKYLWNGGGISYSKVIGKESVVFSFSFTENRSSRL